MSNKLIVFLICIFCFGWFFTLGYLTMDYYGNFENIYGRMWYVTVSVLFGTALTFIIVSSTENKKS